MQILIRQLPQGTISSGSAQFYFVPFVLTKSSVNDTVQVDEINVTHISVANQAAETIYPGWGLNQGPPAPVRCLVQPTDLPGVDSTEESILTTLG